MPGKTDTRRRRTDTFTGADAPRERRQSAPRHARKPEHLPASEGIEQPGNPEDYGHYDDPDAAQRDKSRNRVGRHRRGKMAAGSIDGARGQFSNERLEADVIAAYGRQFLLAPRDGGPHLPALALGRRLDCVVGDHVVYRHADSGPCAVERVEARRNQVMRSDHFKKKTIAANVDQAAVLISGHPYFDEALLMRVLIALSAEDIPVMLLLTKQDLLQPFAHAMKRAGIYPALGYRLMPISAQEDPDSLAPVREALAGRRTVLLGQSGMGKSTLLNALIPTARQQTSEISEALDSGRHTTTFSRAFTLPDGDGWLIDTPGFQKFEVAHLSRWQVLHALPDFKPLLGQCRFNNCLHQQEPGCAIREAAQRGEIDPGRYQLFCELPF